MKNRAWAVTEIKSVDDERRVIEGIATSVTPDRMGDVVEPKGAKFALPLPLLWQHDSGSPVGHVEIARAGKDGISIRARLAKIDEPGELKNLVDKAWQAVKAGLVRGLSIGFRPLEHGFLKDGSGVHFKTWEWLELSLVTVPANAEANIATIKSIDSELLIATATGQEQSAAEDVSNQPGDTGKTIKPVKSDFKRMAKKTIAEQISAFEATRAAKAARMTEIMEAASEEGVTLDTEQKEEYDTAEQEVKEIDDHLKRLESLQEANLKAAVAVEKVDTQKRASEVRGGVIHVKNTILPPATGFTRYVMALARAKGSRSEALAIAQGNEQWMRETPEVAVVLKAAVNAGTTTDAAWAAPLVEYQILASEFVEYLRPQTVVGRIPGLRRVPFNIKLPRQTAGSSTSWVGEGDPKPVSALAFDSITLRFTKAAGIVVLTDELVRFSNPSAEALVRADLTAEMAQFLDEQFLDPSVTAVTDVSPAAITQGAGNDAASGATADDFRDDATVAFNHLIAANVDVAGSVWIMQPSQALRLSMMMNPLGQSEFAGVSATGGTLFGLPVITSNSVPSGLVILVKPSEILLADDGGVAIDVSREASLQMQSDPSVGDYQTVSLWQTNMVGIRAEKFINWRRRNDNGVYYITGANYGTSGGSI